MRLPWVTRKQAEAEIARQRQEAVVREQALREQVAREQSARILTAFLPDGMSAEGWIKATTSPEFTDDQQYRMGVGELMRASFAQSAMPGVPTQLSPTNSPYPVYQFNQPYAFAVPQPPYRPPGQTIPVSVDTLRQLADLYPVARACINHIKRELWAQPLSLGLRDPKDRSPASATALAEAKAWFSRKGGLGGVGRHRRVFESMVLEDLCVIGSSCTYYSPTRGGRPYEALAIDASTIRPKTDAFGHRGPGAHWYEQWIYGVKVGDYGADEMTYDGLYQLSYTPYPKSPIEYLVWIIDTGLRSMDWNRRWFTDGDSPSDRVALPQNWTFEQTLSYMEYVRGLYSGNAALRQMTRYMPGGSAAIAGGGRKDQDFEQFELDTARKCSGLFGVQLASLGFMGEQYKVSQENSIEATTDVGMAPYRLYLKDQYDEVLERKRLSEAVECKFMEDAEEDASSRTERLLKAVGAPWKTINEARAEDGDLDPIDDGDEIIVSSMTIPLSQLLNPPPEAAGPAAGAPLEAAERAALERGDSLPDGRTPEQRAAYLRDLDVWQAAALEQLARGERILMQPVRTIRAEEHGTLVQRLLEATSEDDVRWAFGAARVIETLLRVAGPAPSGGGDQPHFVTIGGKVIPIGQQRPGSGGGRTPAARTGERPGVRDSSQLRRPNYHRATDAERKQHKIPPAGQHAEVSDDPNHHLLATWIDAKGKEQSRYSAAHAASKAALKFNRVRQFNGIVKDVQAKIHAEIEGNGPNKEEAAVLRLIHHTAARVGTAEETGGAKKAYGASTLLAKHVHTDANGNVRLSYTGKKGVKQEHVIEDPAIADDLKQRAQAAGGPDGRLFDTKDKKILGYVKQVAGDFKTHDFRTWNATATARRAVMSMPAPTTAAEFDTARRQVGDIAAKKIGDTRDVALESYVDPLVFHEWGQGLKG